MCERELETEQNCNILTPTLLAITAFLSRSPGLLNRGPGGPASLGAGFLYSILSPTHLISKLVELLYNSVHRKFNVHSISSHKWPKEYPLPPSLEWHHRAETTAMQFTGHPLSVHQFVTVPWDFNPVPYYQLSSPTPMEYALPPSLE